MIASFPCSLAFHAPHAVILAQVESRIRTVLLRNRDLLRIDLHAEDAIQIDDKIEDIRVLIK